jgi:hypothetical protein
VVAVAGDLWLPSEEIKLKDGTTFVGYVVQVDGAWATILGEEDRRLSIIRARDIDRRRICSTTPDYGRPIMTLIPTPGTPACDAPGP